MDLQSLHFLKAYSFIALCLVPKFLTFLELCSIKAALRVRGDVLVPITEGAIDRVHGVIALSVQDDGRPHF